MQERKNMVLVPKLKNLILGTGTDINQLSKAFTLVELIVVITILAILATVGFVGFSSYLAGTRDVSRLAQLKAMSDSLELYTTKKSLPIPDDKVDIRIGTVPNETTVAYQGYIGKNVLETIEYTESGLDPKDKTYFSYYLSKNKKYFQLMAFLEEENTDVKTVFNNSLAIDYSDRKFIVKGRKLGILVDENNSPIQENLIISGIGYLNIENTNDTYKAILENGFELVGTGAVLKMLAGTSSVGGVRNSCRIILEKDSNLKGKDGYYLINQDFPTKVYCDMTTDGGGWTRYVKIKGNYTFNDAKECWLAKSTINPSSNLECFNPNRLNFIVSKYMVKQDTTGDGNIDQHWTKKFKKHYPSQIEETSHGPRKCKGGKEYMAVMSHKDDGFPNSELSNVSFVRFGLNYCEDDADREIGGLGNTDWFTGKYMNYSRNGYGVNAPYGNPAFNREDSVKKEEFYIK